MSMERISPEQEQEIERLLALAHLQRIRGQWVEAEDTCRKAVDIAPKEINAREMLADVLHECGKLDMARSEYHTIMELSPENPPIEKKFAKVTLEIAEHEREKMIAMDMLQHPHKYVHRHRNPLWAMLLSAFLPGLGQFYNGDMLKASVAFGSFLLFIICAAVLPHQNSSSINIVVLFANIHPVAQVLGIIALILYVTGMIDAPIVAEKFNKSGKKSP